MQTWVRYTSNAFFVVATPLLVLGLIFQILMFTPLYSYPAFLLGISSMEAADRIHHDVMFYYANPFTFTFPALGFNEEEASHLNDVKLLIWKGLGLYYLIALVFYSLVRVRRNDESMWASIYAGLFIPILPTAAMAPIIIFFESLFNWLHPFFFEAGTWTFPEESFILQVYPLTFFLGFTITLLILTTLCSIVLVVLMPWIRKKILDTQSDPHFSPQ